MTTTKPHESASGKELSSHADDWIRQFVKHFELHVVDLAAHSAADADPKVVTARAILETFVDSGMERDSVLELLGHAAVAGPSGEVAWNDALNQRRFALIDRDIHGV